MAMNDFVRRSMQIVTGGFLQSTTDYFDNAISFVNDVKEIKDMGLSTASDSMRKFNELRQSGAGKKIRDWFYNEGGVFGDFDFDDDDDFDAGFEIDSADSVKDEEKPLSKSMMSDIAKKQTGAMYKAFGKQAEMGIANTAEIVSTINTRTAELTASVNNVNNTLIQIGKRLDLIVEWTSARTKQEQEREISKNTLIDYGGNISLSGIANQIKNNMDGGSLGTMLSIGKSAALMMSPEDLLSTILSQTILDKDWKKLGNKSINDIGEFLNDTVGEVIQNTMAKVLTTQNDLLQDFVENLTSYNRSSNYQNFVPNQYNDKPAVFDGITRKSIVTIIPGYLNEILKAVNNGKGMTVDNNGNLSDKNANSFVQQVSSSYFRAGLIGWETRRKIKENNANLSTKDITNAIRTMVGVWIMYLRSMDRTILDAGEITDMSAESTQYVISTTSKLLASKGGYSEEEWNINIMNILMDINEFQLRTEIQRVAKKADEDLVHFAKTHANGSQAKTVTLGLLKEAFAVSYDRYNDSTPQQPSTPTVTPTAIGSDAEITNGITLMDYAAGIMERLNRGVNVFITGQGNYRSKRYNKIEIRPGYSKNSSNVSSDGDIIKASPSPQKPVSPPQVSTDLPAMPQGRKPEWYAASPEEVREAQDRIDADIGTPDDQLIVKSYVSEYNKQTGGKIGRMKNKIKKHFNNMVEDSRVERFLPEEYFILDEIWGDIKSKFAPLIPERFKNAAATVQETDAYRKAQNTISNSSIAQGAKSGINSVLNKGIDMFAGKRYTTWDGETVRADDGLFGKIGRFKNSVSNKISDMTPTSVLERRAKNIVSDYGPDKTFEDSDSLHMQVIASMINVAMSNGDYSTIDDQALRKEMNEINDPELKRSLSQSVLPLMRKNESSGSSNSSGSSFKPKSSFGKLAVMAIGAVKMILRPMVTYIKGVAKLVFALVKNAGSKILGFAKWGITRGLRQIKYGAKSIGTSIKAIFTKTSKGLIDTVYSGIDKVNGFMKDAWSNLKERMSSKKNEASEDESKSPSIYQRLSGTKEKMAEKFSSTGFGRGFTQAYRDRKEAERKASIKEQSEPTVSALKESGVPEIKSGVDTIVEEIGKINRSLNGEDGKGVAVEVKKKLDEVVNAIEKTDEPEKKTSTSGAVGMGFTVSEGGSETDLNGVQSWNTPTDVGMAGVATNGKVPGKSTGKQAGGTGKKGFGEVLGGMLGGMTNIMMGVFNVILSIVTSLEGFKALINLVTGILKESLQPLNSAFQAIIKTLKPVFKQIGGIIKQLAKFIVQVVEVLCDIIKPIMEDVVKPLLEALSPLLDTIITILTPILKVVGIILKVILAPFMGIFKYVLVPIIRIIGDAVQTIVGLLQVAMGVVKSVVGGIISGIGWMISGIGKIYGWLTLGLGGDAVRSKGKEIMKSGDKLLQDGEGLIEEGSKNVKMGMTNLGTDISSFFKGSDDEPTPEVEESKKKTQKIEATDEDVIERTYANGDITNIYNTYAGEYQRGMGGYLNMDQRGCGPIALADMYNRHGGGVSARSLAGSMYGAGTYDPNRGTSVGGYIDTARSLGMNVRAGGVTAQSLKMASPTNPITVVGSGSDYGTRRGNNHFMNVIGTDSHGGAYVSNPLTGRVDRKPASTIAGSALLGLYGSGDEADGGYSFPAAIKEAFKKLKEQASKILGLFSMDKSEDEEVNDMISSYQNEEALEQAKRNLSDDEYESFLGEAKKKAIEAYHKLFPKRDGQSDDDYNKAFEKWFSTHSAEYLADTEIMKAAEANGRNGWQTLATTSEAFVDSLLGKMNEDGVRSDGILSNLGQAYTEAYDDLEAMAENAGKSGSYGSGSSGYFTSDEGVPLWVPYGDDIQITETDMTKNNYNSPLFEFFAKTMGMKLGDVYSSSWFSQRNNPNKEGVGSSGGDHSGIDFTGGGVHGKPLYATTGGVVKANWTPAESAGGGNTLVWEDSAGKLHWYMHMDKQSTLKVNDRIEGGDLIGYLGTTGRSTGDHLHYTINTTLAGSGTGAINPLMYFKNYNPNGGSYGVLAGDSTEEQIYSYLVTSGMSPIGAAGLMGCFKYESDMRSNNLENSYNDQFGLSDEEYTSRVNSGQENENQFITGRNATAWSGQTPGEAVGYGIAQFTSSDLKRDIYNKTVKQGKSIASLDAQLDAIMSVLKSRGIYDTINNAKTPTDANKTFLWKYEAGTGYTSDEAVLNAYPWMLRTNPNGVELRHQYAEQVYNTYKGWTPSAATNTFNTTGGGTVFSINSASDAKMYKALQTTGSTSGTGTGIVITQNDPLNVRSSKSINSDVIGQIPPGTQVAIEYCDSSQWLYVPEYGGYVSADYIKIITSDNTDKNWAGQGSKSTGYGTVNSAGDAAYYYGDTNVLTYTPKAASTVDNESKYDTDVKQILPANDPAWQATWYTKSANYPYFMKQNNRGNYQPTSKGMIQRLNNMGNKLFVNIGKNISDRNQYWKNLQKDYGSVGDAENAMLAMYNEAGSPQEWMDRRHDYIVSTKTKDKNKFPDMLGDLHAAMYGSGDMSDSDFWDSYLGWNDGYINSNSDIPPIDESKFSSYSDDYATPSGIVVNRYNIKRADNTEAEARLRTILANTYNVRSETMEALLQEILDELRRRKNNGDKGGSAPSPKLFDERIPEQVSRLSIG